MSFSLALSLCWSAHAAEQSDPAAPQADATEELAQEVVVTAQRRAERLEDVPISITSVSGEALESSSATRVIDLPSLVPALRLDQSGTFSQPTIRGIGSSVAGPGLSVNVATYVDGFYVPNSLTSDLQLLSVSDVQVLKGPQGTLFGRNATGGAILVTTLDPSPDPTLKVLQTYERFAHSTTSLYGSTGITDTLSVNIAGYYERGDSFLRDIVYGGDEGKFENFGLRTKLMYQPSDRAKLILAYAHVKADDPAHVAKGSYEGLSSGSTRGAVTPSARGEVANDYTPTSDTESDSFYLTGEFELGFATLKSYSQYRDETTYIQNDNDSSSLPVVHSNYTAFDESYSQEFNLASSASDRLDWLLGLYYFSSEVAYPEVRVSILNGPFNLNQSSLNNTDAYAAYADATYKLTDRLYLTGGVRYGVEDSDMALAFPVVATPNLSESWSSVTPRFAIRYEVAERASVYGSYSKGFKAGQLPPSNRPLSIVDPENVDAYEIGYKMAGSSVRFDAAAYYYDYTDLQVTAFLSPGSIVRNAASAEIYGLDAQLTARLSQNFDVRVGAAYTHAEYTDFPTAVRFAQAPSGFFSPVTVDASGFAMQRAPRFTGNVDVGYHQALAGGTFEINGNLYASSKVYFDPVQQFFQNAYELVNLRTGWTTADDRWSFSVFCNNVTDEVYRNQVQPASGAIQQQYGEPRTFGGAITLRL